MCPAVGLLDHKAVLFPVYYLTYEKDYEIEHNDSDGFGLMLPSYARRVNEFLTGSDEAL